MENEAEPDSPDELEFVILTGTSAFIRDGKTIGISGRFTLPNYNIVDLHQLGEEFSAELGYIQDGMDPTVNANWTWFAVEAETMAYGSAYYQASFNAIEYQGYTYTFRFKPTFSDVWTYADSDGNGSQSGANFDPTKLGTIDPIFWAPTGIDLQTDHVKENETASFTMVGLDPNAQDTFTFELVSGSGATDNAMFAISGNQLQLLQAADYEFKPELSIRLKITDQTGRAVEVIKTIDIDNVHELSNTLFISNNTVAELSSDGTRVGILATIDSDQLETITYTLLDDAEGRFTINGHELRVADGLRLDFEDDATHTVTIRATDALGLTFDQSYVIVLTDMSPEIIAGDNRDNAFIGGDSSDTLTGRAGADKLSGGGGNDSLTGGIGADQYIFASALNAATNVDTIRTVSSIDRIVLDNDIFTGLGATFETNEFRAINSGASFSAVDSSDNIIYLKSTGEIFYDRDGSGTHYAQVLFAELTPGATLGLGQFTLIE